MWNAWKTGYRGPWIGPDATSKSSAANAGSRAGGSEMTSNIRAYTTRMCCRGACGVPASSARERSGDAPAGPRSDLGDQRQGQRPPVGFLVEESRKPLVDRPLPRRVSGVRSEPRHERQDMLARLVEERVGIVGDEAPGHEVRPRHHSTAGPFD